MAQSRDSNPLQKFVTNKKLGKEMNKVTQKIALWISLLLAFATIPAISTAATGAAAGAVTLGFTAKDAAGVVLVGVPVTFTNLANVSSQTENPYTTLTICQGGPQGMSSPATDVWYSFVPTGNSLDITITDLFSDNIKHFF